MGLFEEPQNLTNIQQFLQYINEGTNVNNAGGMVGVSIIMVLAFISFSITKFFTTFENALIYSLFLSVIVSILVYSLDLITFKVLSIVMVFFAIGLYFLVKTESKTDF